MAIDFTVVPEAEIRVRVTEHALHCWPGAPDRRGYLRAPHRHLFAIEASCLVRHDEREIEFHDLQDEVRRLFVHLRDTGTSSDMSCERMARHIATELSIQHKRTFFVFVSEDGECGALVGVQWQ